MQEATAVFVEAAATYAGVLGTISGTARAGGAPVSRVRRRPSAASATIAVANTAPAPPPAVAALTPAQEALLLEHLSVVRHVARDVHHRLPQHVELEELVSAGTLGLLDAVRKFNAGKHVQFRSYAQFRVRGAILDSLRSLDWSPRELRRKGRAMQESTRTLQLRLNRMPVEAEIAADMGMSLLQLQQLAGQLKGLEIGSLHVARGEDSSEEEASFVPAKETENPLFQLLEGESRDRLRTALDTLPERERLVMTLYYFEELSMREIGLSLGVVESRVSQMHHAAIARLRGLLADLRAPGRQLAARRAS